MTRIVQSFWSGGNDRPIRGNYGWLRPEYHLFSRTLSAHLIRAHYDELVLYTDKAGEDLLIGKLKLPYTEVHVELDALNYLPSAAWSFANIYTYGRQRDPFLYLDGDVFIWKPFDKRIAESRIAVQNVELIHKQSRDEFVSQLDFVPWPLRPAQNDPVQLEMYNTGVFGGQDLGLIEEYYRVAAEGMKRNERIIPRQVPMTFGLFFEQMLVTQIIKHRNVEAEKFFPEVFDNPYYAGLGDFEEVPFRRTYLHLLGQYKINSKSLKLLGNQLRQEFPCAYEKVIEVCEDEGLLHENKSIPSRALLNRTKSDRNGRSSDDESFLLRDIECHSYYKLISSSEKRRDLTIVAHPSVTLERNDESVVALVPEINQQVSKVSMDDLDVELFQGLNEPQTLEEILASMAVHFDDSSSPEYESLILARLRSFIFNCMIVIET